MDLCKDIFWSRYEPVKDVDIKSTVRVIEAAPLDQDEKSADRVVVYEVQHSESLSSAIVARALHDVRRLKEIRTAGLLCPVEIVSSGSSSHVVLPCCDESLLSDHLKSGLSVTQTLQIARSLLKVLQDVHDAGLVLRCLCPSDITLNKTEDTTNAIIGGCPPVMLLNAFDSDCRATKILQYAAPETLGALEYDIRAPADLYSLGIVLFECLTGQPPFCAETSRELLFHHVTTPVPDLRGLNPEVPAALSEIVQRLLQKHPRDRYQSAAGVLFDIEHVARGYGDTQTIGPVAPLVLGTFDQRESLIEPAHVGRDRELATLKSAIANVAAGSSQSLLITASSGVGKTRLLQEASTVAVSDGFRVLRAQGQNQPGLSPMATMVPVIQALVGFISEDEELRVRLHQKMQNYANELHAVAAELALALQLPQTDSNDKSLTDRRIAVAVATLIGNLSTPENPVLLLIDDAQWADDLTLTMLDCWQISEPVQTLLVVSSRPADDLVVRLKNTQKFSVELTLVALAKKDSDLLLKSMAGDLPGEILDAVWQLAHGNPFVSSAVLRGLVEGKVLIPDTDSWKVDQDELRNLQMSGEAAEVLKQRLVRLPTQSFELLAVGAVLGKEFSTQIVAELTGLSYETALEHLVSPRDHHLIWEKAADGVCHFAHDQIREAVLDTLTSQKLVDIHLAAAEYLTTAAPDSHYEIASHYDAANCPEKALPSAIIAGRSALARHALGVALQQYSIALRSCKDAPNDQLFEILNGMGTVFMLSGRYLEAEPMLMGALIRAQSAIDEAEVSLKLGELAFKRDDKDEAVECWETALRKLGGQLPGDWMMPFYTLKEIAVQALHSVFPKWLVHSRNKTATIRDRLLCRLYSRLAYGYWYLKGKVPLLFVHLRGMNLAETFAPTAELAQAYSEHAPAMSLIPLRNRGIAYGRRSLDIRTKLDDVWGQGQSLHFLAIALYAAGRYEECIDVGRRSVRILDRAGDFWEKHIAQYQVAASLFRIGRLTEAVQLAREAYDSGIIVGDDQVCGNIIDIWARATNGDLPNDIVQKELERPRADVQGRAHVLLARGVQLIAEQRLDESIAVFAEGIKISLAAGITNCYTAPLYAWKATALRIFLEEDSPLTRRSRQRTIRGHRRAAWLAVLVSLRFRSELPHALRELAWSQVFQNKIWRATYLLRWSIRAAQAQSARFEQLQSEMILEQIRLEMRYTKQPDQLQIIQEKLDTFRDEQLPSRVPMALSLVDRFDSLLESGRTIATATDPQEIIASTISAGMQLLRSDSCRVVPVDAEGQPADVAESLLPLVVSCVTSKEAKVSPGPTKEFRSLVACPVNVRGASVAVLVVGNTEVRDLFGENECRIITYITTICGTALENAEGFLNLRRLNENLENIVTERTAAVEARSLELQKTADDLLKTQGDLAAARDVAEVANQAKTDFLAHISHEIRTPIGAILGFTEMLQRSNHGLHTEQQQHLARVQSNGTHLLQLLNDLLDLSKIEAGQLTVERIEAKPFRLLTDILASLESRAIDKGLTLTMSVYDGIPESIQTDPTRLRQIVTNLIGNAIKFTSDGSVEVLIETLPTDELLRIHIQDSGVGIPAAAQASVFEPFQQADETVNRNFGGTGLGLPISRKLARALGGDITVASAAGKGSTFTVTIGTGCLDDVQILTPAEAVNQAAEQDVQECVDVDLTHISILVADDILANREFLSHTLTGAGATVQTVENGEQAVDAWSKGNFDLIVMDMRMPIMDGYEAVTLLRKKGAEIPIVALTANGMTEDEQRCNSVGCTGYLTKPISMDALLMETAKLLGIPTTAKVRQVQQASIDSTVPKPNSGKPLAQKRRIEAAIEVPKEPFFRDLAAQLLTKLTQSVPCVFSALDFEDVEYVAEQAHWMKGTGGTVGLPIITTIALELEDAAKARDVKMARTILYQLDDVIEQLGESLQG